MSIHIEAPDYTVIKAAAMLGEGPLWCVRTQSLLWIDGHQPQYFRWRWGAADTEAWPLERPPAALAQLADGRLLIAFRERMGVMDAPGAVIQEIDMPGLTLADERFNDAKVDRQGRLWIGTIDRTLSRPIGHLWRMDADGIRAMGSGFALSNGMAWSPDQRWLYFSESFERLVHRYRFDAENGNIVHAGTLASFQGGQPKPDGLTVDSEGGVWCAVFGGGCVNRYRPDGTLERSIRLPVTNPTSCMFGGPDLKTLFVTTAIFGLSDEARAAEPLAGSVLAFSMEVAGLPESILSPSCILLRDSASLLVPKGLCHV